MVRSKNTAAIFTMFLTHTRGLPPSRASYDETEKLSVSSGARVWFGSRNETESGPPQSPRRPGGWGTGG